jgi:hypothetical protein
LLSMSVTVLFCAVLCKFFALALRLNVMSLSHTRRDLRVFERNRMCHWCW